MLIYFYIYIYEEGVSQSDPKHTTRTFNPELKR